jgi:multidrug resistance efflux pump
MRRTKILATVALLAAVAAGLGFWWPFSNHEQTLQLPGVVEIQEVRLSSKIGGRVAKVTAAEGELVEAGRPLVYFEAPELEAQREQVYARLLAARADLEKARNGSRPEEKASALAAARSAEARHEKLRNGARQEELDQARADLAAVQADWKRSVQDLERNSRLMRTGAIARGDFEIVQAAEGRLAAQVKSAQARLDLLVAGTRPEELAEAAAEADRARANSDLLQAGTRSEEIAAAEAKVAELEGRLRELDANLREAVVRAPERAVVEVVAVRPGDVTAPNQAVVRVLRAEDLWVKVFVPETELGRVRLNQAVTVTVDAYAGRRFQGTVRQVAAISEFTPRNVQSVSERRHQVFAIKVRVTDPQGVFKSGMAAEVQLPLQ